MMGELDNFITLVVAQVREGSITIGALRAGLSREMEEEELHLLLEIVALELHPVAGKGLHSHVQTNY